MFFASGFLALLPSVAHEVSRSPMGYGLLLGSFGLGAVVGALTMQWVRARWSAEAVVSSGVLIFGLMTLAMGSFRALAILAAVMLVGGASWIIFISLFNVLILNHTPDWVRARVLAVSMLVFQGAMAGGSAAWGALATKTGIHSALMWAGLGTMVSTLTAIFLKLPDETVDLTPWIHWRLPTVFSHDPAPTEAGPVMVTVEYNVDEVKAPGFIKAINRYERIRRRDGAYQWGIFRDLESPERYLETFLVDSWAEHLRQHERSTRADRAVTERVRSFTSGEPIVRHLLYATANSAEQITEHSHQTQVGRVAAESL